MAAITWMTYLHTGRGGLHRNNLLSIDLSEEDELSKLLSSVGKKLFDCSVSIKISLRTCSHATPTTHNTGI